MGSGWFEEATAGSETGALARSIDWSATPLGPPEEWPPALRIAVQVCMSTRFPMLVTWGPELIKIYNDGYREILGTEKHPRAMGAPVREIWPEIWDTIGPLFDRVMTTGERTLHVDQQLVVHRSGFPEETYFTWAYSPIRDDEGVIRGVLDTVMETTEQVVGRRRLRCLGELSTMLQAVSGDLGEVSRVAVEALAAHPEDVVAADIHVRDREGYVLLASTRGSDGMHAVDPALLERVGDSMLPSVDGTTVVAPLAGPGDAVPVGAMVVEANPMRPLGDAYLSFLGLVAASVGTAVSGALRRSREVGELRRVSEALQLAMLPEVPRRPGLAVRYLPAAGTLTVGGDWYDAVELGQGRLAVLVGDCVGSGLDAAALMGQLRSASRALLLESNGPAATIEALDRFAASIAGAECTTVFCGIVDERDRTLTYSCAGHPPPLVVGPDGVTWLDEPRDMPLAVFGLPERQERTVAVGPDDLLLLYTDGLVERRGESLDDGFRRLAEVAVATAGLPLEQQADRLVDGLLPDGGGDDVALLLHRFETPPEGT